MSACACVWVCVCEHVRISDPSNEFPGDKLVIFISETVTSSNLKIPRLKVADQVSFFLKKNKNGLAITFTWFEKNFYIWNQAPIL